MIQKKLPAFISAIFMLSLCSSTNAQLYINGATFTIQPGATVTVQGNITSNIDIQGTGKIILAGSTNQTVDMGGNAIPNLQMNNAANATLASNISVTDSLQFTAGKITLNNNNFTLSSAAIVSGQGTGKFLETDSSGQVFKSISANVAAYEVPVGLGTNYRPAFVTTNGTYSSATVGVRVAAVADPNKPPAVSDYLLAYWPVTKTGITGTVTIAGQYIDAGDISGTESNLKGYFFNGTDWSSAGETVNNASNQVAVPVTTATGDVYGMDGFILLKAKVFLQGAFNTVTGAMNDALRTTVAYSPGNPPTGNLLPASDPYRTAPYNTVFTHVNNAITETAAPTVFYDQANSNNNIVDWVFVELRNNATSGNTILQTRSALLQRDGDIVDIDGVSPLTFNNVVPGTYTIAVLHRNHLGISTNPNSFSQSLSEQQSTAATLDFTTSSSGNLFGTAGTNYLNNGTVNMLYAGNANINANVKYSGSANDASYILSALLAGNGNASVSGYSAGDLNMNRTVKYSGSANDASFILSTVLGGNGSGIKTQSLPN